MLRFPALILVIACAAPSAHAARSYDNCTGYVDAVPAVITTQGTWCLRQDVSTGITTGAAIEIAANNVTLDCNDFKIGGLAAGLGTETTGILVDGPLNATIRHCTIRGFYRGIRTNNPGAGHLVENNRLEGNTHLGIHLNGANSIVRDNNIIDTGGSTQPIGWVHGISGSGDDVSILDNTISGLIESEPDTPLTGISYAGNVIIGRNRITGLSNDTTGTLRGISASFGQPAIHDNVVRAASLEVGSVGINCGNAPGIASRNLIFSFETAVNACTSSGNLTND